MKMRSKTNTRDPKGVFVMRPQVKHCNILNLNKVCNLLQLEEEETGSNTKPFKFYPEMNIFLLCVQAPFTVGVMWSAPS